MTSRRKWALVPGFVALAGAIALLSAYSGASSSQNFGPDQPIAFPHPVHVQTLGLNCLYCHYTANKSPDPGLPAVGTCLGCHKNTPGGVGPNRPAIGNVPARQSTEIKKLLDEYADASGQPKKPIEWVRIHKLPEYVHFPHMRHVNAGVACQSCHGQVQRMAKVFQFSSLNMGWCVNCHVNGYKPADAVRNTEGRPNAQELALPPKKARYDCGACHY
jgi:cytochrome c3-like protein